MHNLGLDPGTGKTVSFKRTGAKCDGGTARSKMSKSKPLPASYSRLHRVSCSYSGMSSRSVACILSFCPLPGASQSVSFLSHVLIIPIVESSWPAFFPSPSFLQHEHPPSFQPHQGEKLPSSLGAVCQCSFQRMAPTVDRTFQNAVESVV